MAKTQRQPVWVVQRGLANGSEAEYLTGHIGEFRWTIDIEQAIQLAREVDGKRLMSVVNAYTPGGQSARTVLHDFI
jgi:hypothetical protein